MKEHLKWLWTYLAISGVLSGVLGLAFLFLPGLTLRLLALPLLARELLLIEASQDGPGQGEVVPGVVMARVMTQHLLVSRRGRGEIADLEASVAQVVGRIRGHLGSLLQGEGISGLDVAPRTVEGDAPPIGVAELLGRPSVVALPE